MIRFAVTRGGSIAATAAGEVGRATITNVPPGFYRYSILSDASLDGRQRHTAVQGGGLRRVAEGQGVKIGGSGPEIASVPGYKLLVSSLPQCVAGVTIKGPFGTDALPGPSCVESSTIAGGQDPQTGFCSVNDPTTGKPYWWVWCGEAPLVPPAAVGSRSVHQIEFDADPAKSEWKTCGVNLPQDGTKVDLDEIAGTATAPTCPAGTVGTSSPSPGPIPSPVVSVAPNPANATAWKFTPGASECLGPTEKVLYPGGVPTDVTATYAQQDTTVTGTQLNLPVAVMTYTFRVPKPATYATIALNFSYKAENAIIAARVRGGADSIGDTAGGILLIDTGTTDPVLKTASKQGTTHQEWALMTSGGTTGTITLLLTPTRWIPTTPSSGNRIARVQLCAPAMRLRTFAKAGWSTATSASPYTQTIEQDDRGVEATGLIDQVDPSKQRIRARYDATAGAFRDLAWNASPDGLEDTWEWNGTAWTLKSPTTRPAARMSHALAYDAANSKTVLFGGYSAAGAALGDTWTWNGTTWTKPSLTTSPPARHGAAMAYDASRSKIVLFGGISASGAPLSDTWEWNGTAWTERTGSAPPGRSFAALSYDGAKTILFGGLGANNQRLADTWSLNATGWTQLSPATLVPGRSNATMTYDASVGKTLMFGGLDRKNQLSSEVWSWDRTAANWTSVAVDSGYSLPTLRFNASLAYDSTTANQYVVLSGGQAATTLNDLWKWTWGSGTPAHGHWVSLATTGITRRANAGAAFDSSRDKLVVFGGSNGPGQANTWSYDGATWLQRSANAAPTLRTDAALAYDASRDRTVAFGGMTTARQADTWEWDGTTWTQRTPATSPSARDRFTMAYDAARSKTVLFGGVDANGARASDTWEWNGTTWAKPTLVVSPPARSDASMSYDAVRHKVVLFGGIGATGYLGDTWEYDGIAWTKVSDLGPTARARAAMAYDAAHSKTVLFGGASGGYLADTWTWDGTLWTQQSPSTSPTPRFAAGFAHHDGAAKTILVGGLAGQGPLADTWSWNGTTWTQETPAARQPLGATPVAYDSTRSQLVLLGAAVPGAENEDLVFGIQVPKDTSRDAASSPYIPNPAASPNDGPAYLYDIRAVANPGPSVPNPATRLDGIRAYDPLLGATELDCNEQDPSTGTLCASLREAVSLLDFDTAMMINGRAFGYVGVPHSVIAAGSGKINWVAADSDDSGAFGSRWVFDGRGATTPAFDVADYYGDLASDGLNAAAISVVTGWLSVTVDQSGQTTLIVGVTLPAGDAHTVSVNLNCATVDGSQQCT